MLEEFRDRQMFLVSNQATRLGGDPHAAGLKALLAGLLHGIARANSPAAEISSNLFSSISMELDRKARNPRCRPQ